MQGIPLRTRDEDEWSKWVFPLDTHRIKCCDCGLVHDVQFGVVDGEIVYRARLNNKATVIARRMNNFKVSGTSSETSLERSEASEGPSHQPKDA